MRDLFKLAIVITLFAACNQQKKATANFTEQDSTSLSPSQQEQISLITDSIGVSRSDSLADVLVSVDWPKDEKLPLADSVRLYICKEMVRVPSKKAKVKAASNGTLFVKTTVDSLYQELAADLKNGEGFREPGMVFSCSLRVFKLEESDHYVTYMSNSEGFTGGAHGYATSTGVTFRKSDGKRIGYDMVIDMDNEETPWILKNQHLFLDPSSKELHRIIKEGVRSYFAQFETDVKSDENLADMLIGVNDVNNIPLPTYPPYFTAKGLCFSYQQYDIAPYAAGMPSFIVPYEKIAPLLTKEAKELIPNHHNTQKQQK